MRSKSYLFLLLVLGLGVLSAFVYNVTEYKRGLDVAGGVRLTYRMDTSELSPDQRAEMGVVRERIQSILMRRAGGELGVVEPTVVARGQDQFLVELPEVKDAARAEEIMGKSARIEFYHAKNIVTERVAYRPYEIAGDETRGDNPAVTFRRRGSPDVITPEMPEYQTIIDGWELILSGEDLKSARPEPQGESTVPYLSFSAKGAEKMENWSRRFFNQREYIAAVLDKRVLSIAAVEQNAVLSDHAVITGTFTPQYVKSLTDTLSSGALPVDLELQSSERVDPTIGKEALNRIIVAGAASFVVITLFLLAYYAFPGLVALIALGLYVLFTLTVMKYIGATFSLATIAGFILSVGMAVDANILVFERFKEEMKAGKSLLSAIQLGFSRALPAIVDSNACTILTSLVLLNLGTGPVKGFATSLIIGVAISLFTAVVVTRSLLNFLVGSGIGSNPKWYALNRNWFGERLEATADQKPLQIVNKPRLWFGISVLTIIPGVIFMAMGGLRPNVEFKGGYEAAYSITGSNLTDRQIVQNLERNGFHGANVKFGEAQGGEKVAYVTLPPDRRLTEKNAKRVETVAQAAGLDATKSRGFTLIGPAVQQETLRNAILGVVISTALIIVFLAVRFGVAVGGFMPGLRFGFSAVGALLHDILVVIGIAAIVGYFAGWEVSALFITAMLTIIGFSVHDTIVIFDRIRENLHKPLPGEDLGHLMNRSITQSFARSINTSMTVIATLIILIIWGTSTPDLKFFVVAMLVGILSGTYSSIFNAAPILYLWDRAVGKNKGEEHTLVGIARAQASRSKVIAPQAEPVAQGVATGGGRTYGQVRRRANAPSKGRIEIEDREP